MNKKYPKIFEPLTIKRTTIKNRIAMTPMGTNYGETSGEMSSRHMNYYTLRAKGGTGLIILENANVEYPVGSNGTSQIRIDHDSFMPRFYQLVETLHKSGTTVAIQINHAGASASSARTGMQTVSSSNIPTKAGGEIPRPMTREEILHTVRKYGEAARRARDIGFDAIEIHCGHSYLMSQFISPYYNKRTDEFGGSVENRLRFPRMVLEEVRKQVGPWFPIIVRISAEERVEGGNTLEDTLEYLEYLDEFVDLYDVSCGLNPSLQYQIDSNFLEDGWRSYMARAVKDKFGKPVMNAGNYRDPEVVEKILESGDVDIVGMGRGLIAEPDWVNKVENGQEELLRKCISCNVGCAGNRIGVNRPIRCTVNPAVPEGDVYKKLKVNKLCNVVVIGAGTAGMEAACTAAEVGCNVFLFEKSDHIGGLSSFISDLPSKQRMKDFPKYLEARAARLDNLYIFLNTEATIDKIRTFKPDIIVHATGSVPLVPPIKGLKENLEAKNVSTIFDMISSYNAGMYPDDFCKDKEVVVVGGGSVGLDVVEYFAPRGAKCTIIDMLPAIGMLADPVTKCSMRETFDKYNVKEYVNTALQEVKENAFTVKLPDGTIRDIPFDLGFNCLGMRANDPLLKELEEAFGDTDTAIYNIGDSVRARRIMEGTMDGRAILNVLESKGLIDLDLIQKQ
ncbi:FAD-dependent oxidoreductase [uncultured Dubosiella sp.]|jgi:2,4-dienoyl-CoA reductase-like NADH-dependent reductase (Old Yellow Enzyme family)/NADPH-dependent 2,4-dienoyl-CoA reductase/sulfur reductase-like enzyme|uniref:oxidoreductase n=1 Tax=uncultured Dubosiella sp. TaxID=1937011 RepID=UPI00208BB599|nr:FAD-dependent oxidoreductase [uncultured Dubosiella sp.]GJM57452.1 2,4-dienoyl-CoA reductase [Erysipelotrichaceae bacterium OPF54]